MLSRKQRFAMRKRPKALPVGSLRQWEAGTFAKVARGVWKRVKTPEAKPPGKEEAGSGLMGLLRTLKMAAGRHPAEVVSLVRKVASELAAAEKRESKLASLAASVATIYAFAGPDMAWELYCARQLAKFNEGQVDLAAIPAYVAKAKAFYGGKLPGAI